MLVALDLVLVLQIHQLWVRNNAVLTHNTRYRWGHAQCLTVTLYWNGRMGTGSTTAIDVYTLLMLYLSTHNQCSTIYFDQFSFAACGSLCILYIMLLKMLNKMCNITKSLWWDGWKDILKSIISSCFPIPVYECLLIHCLNITTYNFKKHAIKILTWDVIIMPIITRVSNWKTHATRGS